MTDLTRRNLLAAGTAAAALAAAPAAAQAPAAPSLKGKSFLITGTSSGFGHLGALHYARAGAKVFATMRNVPRPEAEALRQAARDEKLDLTVIQIDVTSDEQVTRGVAEALRLAGGSIDVLVNNAGVVMGGPAEVHDMEAMKLQFETNVFGPHRMHRALLPAMRGRKSGLIVNISSQVGRVVMPGGGLYSPTKFALEAMSEQLAYELWAHGIEVTIIQPGGYPTEVGQNRARYTQALANRAEPRHADGYPAMIEQMRAMRGGARSGPLPAGMPDPMDVPRAIAEIAAMPAGKRPLRRAVHPGNKPQLEVNRVSAESQLAMLGRGPFAEAARGVHD